MAEMTPLIDMGGNNNGWGAGGAAALGGFGGALVGSWFGDGWGNRGNGGQCCGSGAGAYGDLFLMNAVSDMRNEIGSVGRDQLMQTAGLQSALCQGFGGVASEIGSVGASLAQGQCRTEAAVLTTGLQGQIQQKDNTIFQLNANHASEVQGMRNAYELKSSIDTCCCTTNANIKDQGCQTREVLLAEGCATRAAIDRQGNETRALIAQLDRERLLRESAAKDARIAALESQQFNTALAAGTSQQTRNDMNAMLGNILGHMAVICGNRAAAPAASSGAAAA